MSIIFDVQYNPAFPPEWEGLGYESAEACTPRWYGVSFGDGSNGVSHMWPSYYVRTFDPWTLASAALIDRFDAGHMAQASEELDTGGEADYGISATLYEPLDREEPESHYHCESCDGEWDEASGATVCESCGSHDITEEQGEYESWCDANGAYMICEVFPVESIDTRASRYDSLESALSENAIRLARGGLPDQLRG